MMGPELSSPAVAEFIQDIPRSSRGIFPIIAGVITLSIAVILAFFEVTLLSSLAGTGLLLAVIVLSFMRMTVSRESILVMRAMGIQLRTEYSFGGEKTSFISCQDIDDIIINEAITMHRVIYYLAVLLKARGSDSRIIPLFQHSLPPLKTLTEIQQGCLDVLRIDNG